MGRLSVTQLRKLELHPILWGRALFPPPHPTPLIKQIKALHHSSNSDIPINLANSCLL